MLKEKNILIIGGAGLIGSELSLAALSEGAKVNIAEKNLEAAKSLKEKALKINRDYENQINIIEIDITNKSSVSKALAEAHQFNGGIDGAVNTAYPKAPGFGKNFFDVDYDTFCKSVNLHLGGFFLVSQVFGEYIREHEKPSSLVNISSIYGSIPPRFDIYKDTKMTNGPEYAVIKAGIIHLTKFLVKEFQGLPVRVNTVSPGGIEDGQPENFLNAYKAYCTKKGMLAPSDVTGAIMFLLSDYSSFITGQNIIVDDGFSL